MSMRDFCNLKRNVKKKNVKVFNPIHLPIVEMRKLMPREIKLCVQHHTDIKVKGQEPN